MSAILPITTPIAIAGTKSGRRTEAEGRGEVARATNAFERLIQITRSNDRLLADLRTAERRLEQAIAYVSDPDSALNLGSALLTHARQKRARIVAQLRANRDEALRILAGRAETA